MTSPPELRKFPRTPHLEGSLQTAGDEDVPTVPLDAIAGVHLVVTEKVDGANAGLRFDAHGALWLQSRGHFLTGGARERHFDLFKRWASAQTDALHAILGDRHALYGEWLYAKHTIYYDALPHYFLAFDVLDLATGEFLSTPRRLALLRGSPVVSTRVLHEGAINRPDDLHGLLGRSVYKTPSWRDRLARAAAAHTPDAQRAVRETDPSDSMEGLYLKHERDGRVVARYKFVRGSFLAAVVDAASHWLTRPIVPNGLLEGVDLFATGPVP